MTTAQIEVALRHEPAETRFKLAARLIAEYNAEQDAIERRERLSRRLARR